MDIYVGNLPYDTEESVVKSAFAEFGSVESVKIVIDHETGRSKGFAFVTMQNDEEARTAIGELDGAELNGREIKVNEARPREDRPRGGGGGGRGGFSGGGRGGFSGGGRGGDRGGFRGGDRGRGGQKKDNWRSGGDRGRGGRGEGGGSSW